MDGEDSLNSKETINSQKVINLPCTKALRAIIVFGTPRLFLQDKAKGLEELSQKYTFSLSYLKRNWASYWENFTDTENKKKMTTRSWSGISSKCRFICNAQGVIFDYTWLTSYTCKILQTCNSVFCCETSSGSSFPSYNRGFHLAMQQCCETSWRIMLPILPELFLRVIHFYVRILIYILNFYLFDSFTVIMFYLAL